MNITEVRIKVVADGGDGRLAGFASITIDDSFVVKDLRIIRGTGGMFVSMPNRRLMDRCGGCSAKNDVQACFCNSCGAALGENRTRVDARGRLVLTADIAHPVTAAARRLVQEAVLAAYAKEQELSRLPGYVSGYGQADDSPTLPQVCCSTIEESV